MRVLYRKIKIERTSIRDDMTIRFNIYGMGITFGVLKILALVTKEDFSIIPIDFTHILSSHLILNQYLNQISVHTDSKLYS